jgi:hypothetical protein
MPAPGSMQVAVMQVCPIVSPVAGKASERPASESHDRYAKGIVRSRAVSLNMSAT